MDLKNGSLVTDDVRLVEPFAEGRDGKVWLADQLDWKKRVAVKFYETRAAHDDDAIEQFLVRAAACQELTSTHVARIFDFGVSDDFTPYVVMDLLRGDTLARRITGGARFDLQQLQALVQQLCEVFAEAQEADLEHLALSPDNVWLRAGRDIDVQVLNFATLPFLSADRASTYLAPEQYLMEQVDWRADLWAVVAVAYLALTGEDAVDLDKRRLMQWDSTPPSELWLNVDVSDELDAWFARGLHRDPDERFVFATEMASAFAAAIAAPVRRRKHTSAAAPAMKVVDVGTPAASADTESEDIVVQEASDDAPGIVIEPDE